MTLTFSAIVQGGRRVGKSKYSEPGKTLIGALLVAMGTMTFFGGLQLNGWNRVLALPGIWLTVAVFYDQVGRNLLRKG